MRGDEQRSEDGLGEEWRKSGGRRGARARSTEMKTLRGLRHSINSNLYISNTKHDDPKGR